MDAQRNLKLRRSERNTLLMKSKHEDAKTLKRDHIKDIIVSQFSRRYQSRSTAADQTQLLQQERLIQDEAATFVRNNPQAINSKDLSTFERILA